MFQQKILDKIFKVLDEQVSAIALKSKDVRLESEDIHQLETLTKVYAIANSSIPRQGGKPPKVKNLDFLSDDALAKYAKGK